MIHGTLGRLHLGDLLQWLQMGGLSGRLAVRSPQGERRLDVLDGRVVFASSTVPEERVATWLAREGMLPGARLRQLLGWSMLRRTLFTDAVVAEGGVPAEALRASLSRLAGVITIRVLHGDELHFTFDPAYPVRDLLGMDLDVEPNTLLLEAAKLVDEGLDQARDAEAADLPFTGEAFERFFWSMIREAVPADEPLDGEGLAQLHGITRDIMGTLAQWLGSSPGLVPLPSAQATEISAQVSDGGDVRLEGLSQASWNQSVLACSVRSSELLAPQTLNGLEQTATELDLWVEMTGTDGWRRPHADRLDGLTRRVVLTWSRAAAAAAPHLGVEPGTAALAAHLAVVPTDLVLWVLASLSVPHARTRQTLLQRLPQRIGCGLARLADFPEPLRQVFEWSEPTPIGACLALARETLDSGAVWLATAPDDSDRLLEVADPEALAAAAAAARAAAEGRGGAARK